MTTPSIERDDMISACVVLIRAHAKAEAFDTAVDWNDLDTALQFARAALPGEYENALEFYANLENQE